VTRNKGTYREKRGRELGNLKNERGVEKHTFALRVLLRIQGRGTKGRIIQYSDHSEEIIRTPFEEKPVRLQDRKRANHSTEKGEAKPSWARRPAFLKLSQTVKECRGIILMEKGWQRRNEFPAGNQIRRLTWSAGGIKNSRER